MFTIVFLIGLGAVIVAGTAGAAALGKIEVDKEFDVLGCNIEVRMDEEKPFKVSVSRDT